MTQSVLQRLKKADVEHYNFIAGRYKEDKIDGFVLRFTWMTYGIFIGFIICGFILKLLY